MAQQQGPSPVPRELIGRRMELPSSLLIWNQLTLEGFFEGHPHILPKIAPILRELVKMIGPGGIRQPIAGTYPVDRVKEAVAHAVKGSRILLSLRNGADNVMLIDGIADTHRSCYGFPLVNRFALPPVEESGELVRSMIYRVPVDDLSTLLYF